MFDFDAGKLLIVGVIALIFIPPKDLPRVLRQVGQFVGKMRRMAAEFQGQFMDAMREADMADLRKEAQKLADAARIDTGLDKVRDLDRVLTSAVAAPHLSSKPVSSEGPALELAQPTETHEASLPDPDPADPDARAFEDLKSELRPLVEEAREKAHADRGNGQPHSA